MKAKIYDFKTEIFLSKEEVITHCKPGEGANTCIWLLVGSNGFECSCKNRHPVLVERWLNGDTNAKRDGCDTVNNFHPEEIENYYSGMEVNL